MFNPGGYEVFIDDSPIQYNLVPYWEISKSMRCVDASCTNTMLGGLFLHATHKPATRTPLASAPGEEVLVSSNLIRECQSSRFSSLVAICDNQGGSPVVATLTLEAGQGKPRPIGVDPVFNPNKLLYMPGLDPSSYYNMSSPLEVNPLTGLPFAFFHQPVPNRPDGYPVFISEYLSQSRIGQSYQFLLDGDFLDPGFSSQLTIEMVTYNQGARIFAYLSMVADWMSNGDVKMTYSITALPITIDGTASQIAYSVVLIALVCVYIVLAVYDTYSAWSIEKKSRWGTKDFKLTSEEEYGKPQQESTDPLKARMKYSRQELREKGITMGSHEKRLRAGGESKAHLVLRSL